MTRYNDRSRSILAQVMACCLTVPINYRNYQWSSVALIWDQFLCSKISVHNRSLKNALVNLLPHIPGDKWLTLRSSLAAMQLSSIRSHLPHHYTTCTMSYTTLLLASNGQDFKLTQKSNLHLRGLHCFCFVYEKCTINFNPYSLVLIIFGLVFMKLNMISNINLIVANIQMWMDLGLSGPDWPFVWG